MAVDFGAGDLGGIVPKHREERHVVEIQACFEFSAKTPVALCHNTEAALQGSQRASLHGDGEKGFAAIQDHFIGVDPKTNIISLNQVCAVAGLGGNPFRDGSFDYYISEPIRANDAKGVGPFMLAALELDK